MLLTRIRLGSASLKSFDTSRIWQNCWWFVTNKLDLKQKSIPHYKLVEMFSRTPISLHRHVKRKVSSRGRPNSLLLWHLSATEKRTPNEMVFWTNCLWCKSLETWSTIFWHFLRLLGVHPVRGFAADLKFKFILSRELADRRVSNLNRCKFVKGWG